MVKKHNVIQHGIFHKGYANFVVRFSSGHAGLSISALVVLLQLTGTRWIAHKYHALEVIMDKYCIYMQHLENMTEDESFPAKERTSKIQRLAQEMDNGQNTNTRLCCY